MGQNKIQPKRIIHAELLKKFATLSAKSIKTPILKFLYI